MTARQSRPAIASTLDQIALQAATEWGDPYVTSVTWVESRRVSAASVVTGDQLGGPNEPVYVLEMRGHFVLKDISMPARAARAGAAPRFPVMALFLDVGTLFRQGRAAFDTWVPLTGLGTPETDSLVGLSPST
jgi:hypothetical protein